MGEACKDILGSLADVDPGLLTKAEQHAQHHKLQQHLDELLLETVGESSGESDASNVRILIRAGANIETRDHAGDTPLHVAARAPSLKAAEVLLAAGALVDARNKDDKTPLLLVASWFDYNEERYAIARLLLGAGADPIDMDDVVRGFWSVPHALGTNHAI